MPGLTLHEQDSDSHGVIREMLNDGRLLTIINAAVLPLLED